MDDVFHEIGAAAEAVFFAVERGEADGAMGRVVGNGFGAGEHGGDGAGVVIGAGAAGDAVVVRADEGAGGGGEGGGLFETGDDIGEFALEIGFVAEGAELAGDPMGGEAVVVGFEIGMARDGERVDGVAEEGAGDGVEGAADGGVGVGGGGGGGMLNEHGEF